MQHVPGFNWKPEDPENTTDLSQVTDKLYQIMVVHLALIDFIFFIFGVLTPLSAIFQPNKTDRHDITEILLKWR
jgi:hypothetical protein